MKAKQKKDIILRLLSERTYGLGEDYAVSVIHIDFHYMGLNEDSYRLSFFPNRGNRFMDSSVLTIISTVQAFKCWSTIKVKHGAPVVYVVVEDDRA